MKLVFTDEARADLLQIAEWIAEDNPAGLSHSSTRLRRVARGWSGCRALILWYRATRTGECAGYPHGDHLIFYRLVDDALEILHVLNGARDYERILFPDE